MVSTTNMGTALLQWHPPAVTHGPLQGYRLRFGRKDLEPLTVIEFPERDNHYTTREIHKGASYTFRLSARNKVGFGEETVKEVTTNEDVPSGYPQWITADAATTSTIQVSWQEVLLAERNGHIVKYALQYKDINSPRSPSELFITAPESSVILDGLKAETTYDIKMCAFTSKGSGPYSPSVQIRTQPLDQGMTSPSAVLALACYVPYASNNKLQKAVLNQKKVFGFSHHLLRAVYYLPCVRVLKVSHCI